MNRFICAGFALAWATSAFALPPSLPPMVGWDRYSNQGNAGYAATVTNIGDFNGDGFNDVAVTAGGWVLPSSNIRQGAVFIYLGNATGYTPQGQPAAYILTTDMVQGSGLGSSISAGDMNGDGYADLVVGAMYAETRGAVYAYYGRPGTPACAANPNDPATWNRGCQTLLPAWKRVGPTAALYYGENVALADVNCDMIDDVIVTTHWWGDAVTPHIGLVDVFYNRPSPAWNLINPPDAIPNWSDTSSEYLSEFGWSLAAGDFNGDYDKVVPTYPWIDNNHDGYAEWGTPDLDLDNDGVAESQGCEDFVIGAPRYGWYNANRGRVYHYLGTSDGPMLDGWYEHPTPNARYGEKLTAVGDVNSDGRVDFVVHNRLANDTTAAGATVTEGGRAYLVQGPGGEPGIELGHVLQGASRFGAGVGSIGKFNPDSCPDFAVGQEGFDTTNPDVGAVYLYYGTGPGCVSDGLLDSPDRIWVNNEYGVGLGAAIGDGWTGSGQPKVLLGMPSYDRYSGPGAGLNLGRVVTATGAP